MLCVAGQRRCATISYVYREATRHSKGMAKQGEGLTCRKRRVPVAEATLPYSSDVSKSGDPPALSDVSKSWDTGSHCQRTGSGTLPSPLRPAPLPCVTERLGAVYFVLLMPRRSLDNLLSARVGLLSSCASLLLSKKSRARKSKGSIGGAPRKGERHTSE